MGSRSLAVLFSAVLTTAPLYADTCREDVIWIHGDFGKARFSVEVADDAAERAQGLMHVDSMAQSRSMLFVYEQPQSVAFWMKNTLIPLDMIFADGNGVIRKIHTNAIPHDETAIPGGNNIQYVLEINGGLADRLGLTIGAQLQHPAIDSAQWPCK